MTHPRTATLSKHATPGTERNNCSQPNMQKNSSAGCVFFTSIKLTQLDAYCCQNSNIIYTL